MRIQRSSEPSQQTFHEMMKEYFKNTQELCDWIINLWNYAKYMLIDCLCNTYALVNLELIKDHWDHENFINCEFLIKHLLDSNPRFYDFEIFIQPKDLWINKTLIYNIIKVPKSTN